MMHSRIKEKLIKGKFVKLFRLAPAFMLFAGFAYADCDTTIAKELSDLSFAENKPGYSYLVAVNSEVICSGSIGSKTDGAIENITITTQFNLASVSKMFTGAAIFKLISSGQLSLDTHITEILPELKETVSEETKVKHLLNHSAALESYLVEHPQNSHHGAYSYYALDSFEEYNNETVLLLGTQYPVQKSEPGPVYEYNNTGYVFLALIVERVSGVTFESYVKKSFFTPLEMNNTAFASCQVNNYENLATDYFAFSDKFSHLNRSPYRCVHGPSNIFSSVQDMSKWLDSIISRKLFGPDTDTFLQSIALDDGTDAGYGYGLMTAFFRGNSRYFHNGVTFGYRTVAAVLPEQNAYLVVLANRSDIDSIGIMNALTEWLLDENI